MNFFNSSIVRFIARTQFPQAEISKKHFHCSDSLTVEEADFFAENGYLVKDNAVSPLFIEKAIDSGWLQCPSNFERNNPESWNFKVKDNFNRTIIDSKGRIRIQVKADEPWLKDIFKKGSCIQSTVESLIGVGRTPELPITDGIYFTFPTPVNRFQRPYIHTDKDLDVVRIIVYLSDVKPGGGGFHVWPGSHLVLRKFYDKEDGGQRKIRMYWKEVYNYAMRVPSVEVAASAGTVIFWHHRLAHAAGINRTDSVRKVFIAGYLPLDAQYREELSVPEDPWEHWSISHDNYALKL